MVGCRKSDGERPLGRVAEVDEDEGLRCANRYGAGESFAKVAGGKERADGGADMLAMFVIR